MLAYKGRTFRPRASGAARGAPKRSAHSSAQRVMRGAVPAVRGEERRIKMKEFRFAGESARAKTLRAAMETVESRLTKKLEGDFSPRVFRVCEHLCVMWREPHYGWTYRFVDLSALGTSAKRLEPVVTCDWSREECERDARKDFAQYLFDRGLSGEDAILEERDRREYASWAAATREIMARRAAHQTAPPGL
jgi:hypothetical protein